MKYTFGTSETAAERLKNISKFFNPLALRFIKDYINITVNLALDLGCGPGYTTDMLYNALKCGKTYGFDISDNFLHIASENFKNYTFIKHDVTKTPFPISPDVIYVRFLLSHLNNVAKLVNQWIYELNNNGMLFIEEVEDVKTEKDVFKKYLEINRGLVSSQGANLFIGSILAKSVYNGQVLCNECITIPVANWEAATWFYPNTVTIWEKEKFVNNKLTQTERKKISEKLLRIKESEEQNSEITWYMRRIVIKKTLQRLK